MEIDNDAEASLIEQRKTEVLSLLGSLDLIHKTLHKHHDLLKSLHQFKENKITASDIIDYATLISPSITNYSKNDIELLVTPAQKFELYNNRFWRPVWFHFIYIDIKYLYILPGTS